MTEVSNLNIPPAHLKQIDHNQKKYLTDAKIKKIALYALTAVSALAGGSILGLSLGAVVVTPLAVLAIPLFAGAAGFIYWAYQIKDYEDAAELQQMREKGRLQSYSELIQEFGLANIQKYRVVSPELLREKLQFQKKIQNIDEYYSNRQECLLESLKIKEAFSKAEAWERKNGNRSALDILLPSQNIYDYDDYELLSRLGEIETKRTEIIQNGIGLDEQRAYIRALQKAQIAHYKTEASLF